MYNFDEITDRSATYSLKWDIRENELPMWVADMDFKTAPEIREALKKRLQNGIFGYTDVPEEWYRAYIKWWKERHDFEIEREWMVFSTGVIPSISSCVRKLTTPAEKIVVLSPVYNIFYNSILNNGRVPLEVPLVYNREDSQSGTENCCDGADDCRDGADNCRDGSTDYYEIDFIALEKALSHPQTAMLIFCNPHNPVGKIWNRDTLIRIGELCRKHGVIVISDEIHCDLTLPGKEYIPFAAASDINKEISVTLIAPTKAFNIAGLQTSAAVIPNEFLRRKVIRALNTDEVAEPNAFAVDAAIAAFTRGGDWLDSLREYLAENRRLVERELCDAAAYMTEQRESTEAAYMTEQHESAEAAYMTEQRGSTAAGRRLIRVIPGDATYLVWIDISGLEQDKKDRRFADFLREKTGLYISDGISYGQGGNNFVRMNVACPRSMVLDGINRFKKGVKAYLAEKKCIDKIDCVQYNLIK
ncbi:MAG: pyridoxal phosphate-dependent aminotransferase [Eubacterium sp.]|nr:pyridoxal phosphate-dependent aminotransferase [Eubacterium sp.]